MFSRPHVFAHVDVPFAPIQREYLEVFDSSQGLSSPIWNSRTRSFLVLKGTTKLRFTEYSGKLIVLGGPGGYPVEFVVQGFGSM